MKRLKRMGPRDLITGGYDAFYREFESPLMRQLRNDAYEEDIGQHSWVGADELRGDIHGLQLCPSKRLLDLGCGPCGPLTFILSSVGCQGTGLELSAPAVQAGRERADSLGVSGLLSVLEADLNAPLLFDDRSFDAAISLDVICHVRDRASLFREIARVLSLGGRFLFTDPTVVTGCISADEVRRRSVHGYTVFTASGCNESLLDSAGFRLIETENRTQSVLKNARGRQAALQAHEPALAHALGADHVQSHHDYLEIVIALAQRGAVSRVMYLAEVRPSLSGQRRSGEP
jgi:SAM-dependent methyltransferase